MQLSGPASRNGGKAIHVFHLIKSLGRGGAETLLRETLSVSDRTRFHFSYGYLMRGNDALAKDLRDRGANVSCFGATSNLLVPACIPAVTWHLRRAKPDIVHCHLPLAGIVGRIAGRAAGIPVIYTEHNKIDCYHPLTRVGHRITWRWQERVIAVSDEVAGSVRAYMGEQVPVSVINNGINVDKFRRDTEAGAAIRRRLGLRPTTIVIGTVAVFRKIKRLDKWLEIAATLSRQRDDLAFVIVGFGELEASLKERAVALSVADKVHFVGGHADVKPYLSAFDLYMMTSLHEGLPIALLEAMAMECAPVCTAAGGIRDVIEHGVNGFTVDPSMPEALVNHITALLDCSAERSRVAQAARRSVESKFSVKRMSDDLSSSYQRCLGDDR